MMHLLDRLANREQERLDGLEVDLRDAVNRARDKTGALSHARFCDIVKELAIKCGRDVKHPVRVSAQPRLSIDVLAIDPYGVKKPIALWCMVSGRTDRPLERDTYALALENEKWYGKVCNQKPVTWLLHDREHPEDSLQKRLDYCRSKKFFSNLRLDNIADIGAMRELCAALWVK